MGIPLALALALAPCLVTATLEPDPAYVGEQVVYRLDVLRRDDVRRVAWGRALSFPGFRVEALPSRAREDPVVLDGTRYLGVEERRALFPVRPGTLRVPEASLRCGDDVEVVVPATTLEAKAVPGDHAPPGWSGVVGRVTVTSRVEPSQLRLGRSARVSVVVEGQANVWDVPAPFAEGMPGAELLAHPPQLARDAAARLSLRRHFEYDLVPLRTGSLELPGIEVAYFEPSHARFAMAATPGIPVRVAPAAADPPSPEQTAASARTPSGAVWTTLTLGILAATALVVLRLRRRRSRNGTRAALQGALRDADAARAAGDEESERRALTRALRLALERRLPGARALSSQELQTAAADRPELRTAAELLARQDAERFAPGAARRTNARSIARTNAVSPEALREALTALRRSD
jgi:hypothetical protein